MIRRHDGPLDPALAGELANLQARAYARTGMRPWRADEIVSILDNPCNRLYTACESDSEDAKLNAFLLAMFVASEAEILALAVDPDYRRSGNASRLCERVIRDGRRAKVEAIILEVAETNRAALALYQSLTFVEVGRRPGYYTYEGNKIDARLLKIQIFPMI